MSVPFACEVESSHCVHPNNNLHYNGTEYKLQLFNEWTMYLVKCYFGYTQNVGATSLQCTFILDFEECLRFLKHFG